MSEEGKIRDEFAKEGLSALEAFIKECDMVTSLREIGATKEMLPLIANSTVLLDSGYKKLTAKEVLTILEECY